MKIEQHPLEDHQVKLIVEIEPERLEANKRRAARKLSERGKIPGFRPGKAPYEVVLRQYGEAAITEEAVDLLVDETYPKVLEETGIKPAAAGKLESIDGLEPPKFTFVIPLEPTVDLGKYRAIRLAYEFEMPGEGQVDEAIEEMRLMSSTTQQVERPIETGDYVLIDIKGELTKPEEGEDPLVVDRQGHAVYVAAEPRDNDFPFKGFPQELAGLSVGESKDITHKFPKDDEDESLRGKTVKYAVTIKTVRGVELPDVNDEFAQMVGGGQTVAEMRENVRQSLERRARDEYDDKYFVELLDKVKAGATLKYPPQVLEHEMEHVVEDLSRRLAQQGLELDIYIKMRNMTREEFMEAEVRPVAVRRLERGLIMDELARKEQIELDEAALGEEFNQTWAALASSDEQFAKATQGGTRASKQLVDAVAMDSANRLMTRRVLERLKAIATGEADSPAEPKAKKAPAKKSATTKKTAASKSTAAKKKPAKSSPKGKEKPAAPKPAEKE